MKRLGWFSWLSNQQPSPTVAQRIAGGTGVAILLMITGAAVAQMPTQTTPMTVPDGYSIHQSVDLGGHMVGLTGSNAMYDTMVNLQSGPRVLGQTFELHALPTNKHTYVDDLSAFTTGFGGDPNSFTKMDLSKARIYEFSGIFRRDRQYFDYDLLGNPNIPAGRTVPIGPTTAPTGSYAWPQIMQSPGLFNTVRRLTDTNLTLYPQSKVTFRAAYSQNIFQGPSLTPSGYQFAGRYSILLQEYQRNSTDDFTGGIDWKPVEGTKLTFEEQVDHYKGDSYFTLAPSRFLFQEADGTPATPLISFDSLTPYAASACAKGTTTILYPNNNGRPIIDPSCAVALSYSRTQPTRILYPTEIFRFQSTSIKNVVMNGDVRYTNANMSLPNYYEDFQGLTGTTRELTYTANASAKREVTAADYGIIWQAAKNISIGDQFTFSNVQQPGTSTMTSLTTVSTVGGATVNNPNTTSTASAAGAGTYEGSSEIGTPLPGYFGQRFLTNDLTVSWYATSRATLSLTYRYGTHKISEGSVKPGDVPIPVGETTDGTVTINENGGIFNVALRPTNNWDLNGTVEVLYNDNAFTPVGPRQTKHYRVHTMYKPKPWATLSGAFNDRERHNNTNNAQADVAAGEIYYGPIDHVDYSRVGSFSADLAPNEYYALDLSYAYSDVYAATNICYNAAAAGPALPGAATTPGTTIPVNVYPNGVCQGIYGRGTTNLVDWYARDFEDAPTNSGSVAIVLSPNNKFRSNIGYRINSVNGTRFFNDARDVNGSLVSTYQSPFVSVAYTFHPGLTWKAEYNFYGYGEGGPSGAAYCSATTSATVTPVPCNDPSLTGPTGLTESPAGATAPRNFHANNVTLGVHYEF